MRLRLIVAGVGFLVAIGCGQDEKIAALEKQNKDHKVEMEQNRAAADYGG
jgi:hypothetical protein